MLDGSEVINLTSPTPEEASTIKRTILLFFGIFGIAFVIVTPPLEWGDEITHFMRALRISDGIPLRVSNGKISGAEVSGSVRSFVAHARRQAKDWEACQLSLPQAVSVARGETTIVRRPGLFPEAGGPYSPWGTLQTAIPIALVKTISEAPAIWFYVGRVANLFTFALLGLAAVTYATRLRATTFTLFLLPSSLYFATTYSVDAFMNGLTFLWTVWVLRLADSQVRPPGPAMKVAAVSSAVAVVLAKLVYLPLALQLLWVPTKSLPATRQAWCKLCLLALVVSAMILAGWVYLNYTHSFIFNSFGNSRYNFEPRLWLADPLRMLASVPRTIASQWQLWPGSLVWQHTNGCSEVRQLGIPLAWACLGLAVLADAQTLQPTLRQRLIAVAVCALTVCVLILTATVGWTPSDGTRAIGMGGRYFLPIIPAAAVALMPLWKISSERLRQIRIALVLLVALTNMLALWSLAAGYTIASGVSG